MGKTQGWISVTHLLALSVALNVSWVFRLCYYEKASGWSSKQDDVVFPNAFSSSSYSSAAHVSAGDDGHEGRIVNLDHGDPTMYEKLWQQTGDKSSISISGWQSMSYFSNHNNLCWFLEPELATQILRLHQTVGNAVTDNRHIVVGSGAIHLFQAALYALSLSQPKNHPISVVSTIPCYSYYKQVVEYLKSGLYKWKGDDVSNINGDEPYIEVVTSPNNPDGFMRQPLLNHSCGLLVHDLAYYWPQYTPITSRADHDIMLFTISKPTGHAGTRIGWALVKDEEAAKRMAKFIELSSIGVSKDAQLRAAKILRVVSDSFGGFEANNDFFELSFQHMAERWKRLREAVKLSNGLFSLSKYPFAFCKYSHRSFQTQPAFAWLKCEGDVEDCEGFFKEHKILTRGGKHFGVSPKFVRISMVDRDANFKLFLKRISMMRQ